MKRIAMLMLAALLLGAGALAGCGDDEKAPAANNDTTNNDTANNDGPDCFEGTPTTHLELLNACTDAVGIEKNPTLPLLEADGTLPPLP